MLFLHVKFHYLFSKKTGNGADAVAGGVEDGGGAEDVDVDEGLPHY